MQSAVDPANAWRWNLETYATRVSMGRWLAFRWHVYLAQKLIEAVVAGRKRIVITAPPQHGKSTVTSQWLPTWFLDMYPERKVILASYAQPLATAWSTKVRDAFDGSNPHTWTRLSKTLKTTQAEWYTRQGGGMKAVGIGTGITGFGGDLILIDDPIKDWAEAQSAAAHKRVREWFDGTLYHRKTSMDTTFILMQTRWHQGDLAGYLLNEHADDWTEIRLPAIAEAGDPLGRAVGEALCPERFDYADLQMTRKAVGPRVWAGLFQQRPAPAEGNIIKRDWMRFYGGPTGVEVPDEGRQFQSWDLNAGDVTTAGSFNVGQAWQDGGGAWLLHQMRDRWSYTETKRKILEMSIRYPQARTKYVERKAAGIPILSELKGKVKGLVPVEPKGSKAARLEAVAGWFEAGDVWFPHPEIAPWVPELVEEVVSFTGDRADVDDQVDALSQALSKCKPVDQGKMKLNLDVGLGAPAWRM